MVGRRLRARRTPRLAIHCRKRGPRQRLRSAVCSAHGRSDPGTARANAFRLAQRSLCIGARTGRGRRGFRPVHDRQRLFLGRLPRNHRRRRGRTLRLGGGVLRIRLPRCGPLLRTVVPQRHGRRFRQLPHDLRIGHHGRGLRYVRGVSADAGRYGRSADLQRLRQAARRRIRRCRGGFRPLHDGRGAGRCGIGLQRRHLLRPGLRRSGGSGQSFRNIT